MNQTYYAMKSRLGGEKRTARDKLIWHYYPVPGCMTHREIIGATRGRLLFTHFFDRPQKSHNLYWRSHPAEYKALLELIEKRKSEKQAKC